MLETKTDTDSNTYKEVQHTNNIPVGVRGASKRSTLLYYVFDLIIIQFIFNYTTNSYCRILCLELSLLGLFPYNSRIEDQGSIHDVKLEWFNVGLNAEQKDAVRRILRGQCRPL